MTRRYIRSRRTPRPRNGAYAPIHWCRTKAASAIAAKYGEFRTPRVADLQRDFGMSRATAYRWRSWYILQMTRKAAQA